MSLDVYLELMRPTQVYWANITHNLAILAREAGIYECLWRPEEIDITQAKDLIVPLSLGLLTLKGDPERFKRLDAPNGWGTYEQFVSWVERYLQACIDNPEAMVSVSR